MVSPNIAVNHKLKGYNNYEYYASDSSLSPGLRSSQRQNVFKESPLQDKKPLIQSSIHSLRFNKIEHHKLAQCISTPSPMKRSPSPHQLMNIHGEQGEEHKLVSPLVPLKKQKILQHHYFESGSPSPIKNKIPNSIQLSQNNYLIGLQKDTQSIITHVIQHRPSPININSPK